MNNFFNFFKVFISFPKLSCKVIEINFNILYVNSKLYRDLDTHIFNSLIKYVFEVTSSEESLIFIKHFSMTVRKSYS